MRPAPENQRLMEICYDIVNSGTIKDLSDSDLEYIYSKLWAETMEREENNREIVFRPDGSWEL